MEDKMPNTLEVPPRDPVAMPAAATIDSLATAAAVREDQVQSAVGFLSHPKVKGSPPATKRSFLERKGLTPAEIEEAFRRVPEEDISSTLPSSAPLQPAASNSPAQVQQLPLQQQYSNALVPAAASPMQQHIVPAQQPLRWSQVVLGLGVAAISAYSFAALVLPKIKEIYASWGAVQLQREAEMEARRLEVLTAVEALQQVYRDLQSSSRSLAEAAQSLKEQTAALAAQHALAAATDNIRNRGDVQPVHDNNTHTSNNGRRELVDIHAALRRGGSRSSIVPAYTAATDFNGPGDAPRGAHRYTGLAANGNQPAPWYGQPPRDEEEPQHPDSLYGPLHGGGTTNFRPLSPSYCAPGGDFSPSRPAPTSASSASMAYGGRAAFGAGSSQNGNSQDVVVAERGSVNHEQARNLHSPQQGQSEPRYDYPTTGALGLTGQSELTQQQQQDFKQAHPGLGAGAPGLGEWGSLPLLDSSPRRAQAAEAAPASSEPGSFTPTFAEVMEMVANGITPPNVRKDIIDTPPNPSQRITESRLTPIPKPWDRRQLWETPASLPADPSAAVSENTASEGSELVSQPPTQNGGGSRSITGPGSTSRSRFAANRPFDNLNSSPTPSDFYSHSSNHMNGMPSSNPQTYLESGSQEQQLLQSFTQDGTADKSGASVPAATAAAAATAVAAAAEQPAPQHHRISILPAPGTGPVWRPPPVPAPTMPSRQPPLPAADTQPEEGAPAAASSILYGPAAQDHITTTSQQNQEQAQATPSVPLASFPLEPNLGTTRIKSGPSSPTSGSPGPRGGGASTLNSNAKPFLASSAAALAAAAPAPVPAPVQKSPKRRARGAVNGSPVADATASPASGVSQEGGWSVVSPPVPQGMEAEVAGGSAGPSSPEVQSHP